MHIHAQDVVIVVETNKGEAILLITIALASILRVTVSWFKAMEIKYASMQMVL